MEAKLKHLEFIQGIVNRLATDSFRLKGWTVVLVSAVVVLLARTGRIGITHAALQVHAGCAHIRLIRKLQNAGRRYG